MSGLWQNSFSTVQDMDGMPVVGAKAYFFAAGTTTPLQTYADYGLTTANPNPVVADGYGRFPSVFFDDSGSLFYGMRVTDAGGTVLYQSDTLPILSPSSGGGSPPAPVDPNAVFATGDLKARYSTATISGWVRCNGRTIGSALSGASERANSDAQALFEYLWAIDSSLTVLPSRGASANADWLANKTMALPDWRGRVVAGLDDMGNSAAGIMTGFTTLGGATGFETHTLTVAQTPAHAHPGSSIASGGNHSHDINIGTDGGTGRVGRAQTPNTGTATTTIDGAHTHTLTIASQGGGGSHNNLQPSRAATIYMRL